MGMCGQHVSVRWYLSLFHDQCHIAQVCVIVQLHDAVQHLDFAGGLLLLRRGLPPQNFYCLAHEVAGYGYRVDGFLSGDAEPATYYHHAILHSTAHILHFGLRNKGY